MKYLVFLKDIDPDTGKISQLTRLCECDSQDVAKSICWSMSMGDDTPNREYYMEKLNGDRAIFLCADTDKIELAWKCQTKLNENGIRCNVVFSEEELNTFGELYQYYGVPYTIVHVGTDSGWDPIIYNLQIESFSETTVAEIISFLNEDGQDNG